MKNYLFCSLYYKKDIITGANKRFENFIYHFSKIISTNEKIIVVVKSGHIPIKLAELSNITFIEIPKFSFLDRFQSYIFLRRLFSKNKAMVVVSDFMPIPSRSLLGHNHYQLIHDIRNFTMYQRTSLLNSAHKIQEYQWKRAQNIMTVSNFTKSQIIKECAIEDKNIFVSYNGLDDIYYDKIPNNKRDIDITYIATFEKRKNHKFLIDALSHYSGKNDLNVLLIGKDLGLKDNIKKISNQLEKVKVRFEDSIDSEMQIIDIYDRTKLFVYPSLYEGFGMPLIEAISRNCKIICSDIPVFREIAADIPDYFNPNEPPIILTKKIERALIKYTQKSSSNMNFIDNFRWSHIAEKFYLHVKNQN
ncbi:MAG: hypothetical protein CBD21_00865 [bacterium TMED161]|nr:hypothetical protein [Candidatus Neomarinimicrobiota bacterium]OUW21488.1 MAG: hypothetical protein CBD21_00865 [bacterium TMED161]